MVTIQMTGLSLDNQSSAFTATSAPSEKPPLPSTLDSFSLFFYILSVTSGVSLVASDCADLLTMKSQMLDGMMSMLGNQWASRLPRLPTTGTPCEKTLALERRRGKAESLLFSQSGYLIGNLVLSIAFFLTGFMLQIFSIAQFGFVQQSRILIAAGVLALGMCGVAAAVIGGTTWHAIKDPDSPFKSRLSSGLQDFMSWISGQWQGKPKADETGTEDRGAEDQELFEVKDDDIEREWHWYDNDGEARSITTETLKVYARLVKNATETEVLDRAVPSFSFIPWYSADNTLSPIFEATYSRFSATDTSFRVKETLVQHLVAFGDWLFDRGKEDKKVVQWCREECKRLYYQSTDSESKAKWFPLWVFFTSFMEDYDDLREIGRLPFEDCVLQVVCSYDQNRKLGERKWIFYWALRQCKSLVEQGKIVIDDITRPSLLRSLICNPDLTWWHIKGLVSLITRGKEKQIWTELSDFISNPPVLPQPKLLLSFLTHLTPSLPDDFTVPPNLDLSSSLLILARYEPESDTWQERSDGLIFYFDHGAFDQLSDISPAIRFLNCCCDDSLGSNWDDDERTSTATHHRAAHYLKEYETRYLRAS